MVNPLWFRNLAETKLNATSSKIGQVEPTQIPTGYLSRYAMEEHSSSITCHRLVSNNITGVYRDLAVFSL